MVVENVERLGPGLVLQLDVTAFPGLEEFLVAQFGHEEFFPEPLAITEWRF